MNRRTIIKSGLATGIVSATEMRLNAAAESNHFYEIRTYSLRNDLKINRVHDFFQRHFLPMTRRLGMGPTGCFTVASGQYTPSLIVLLDYKSVADVQLSLTRMEGDKEFATAWRDFETGSDLPYVRYESILLKAFDGHLKPEVPTRRAEARLFELRTYESRNHFSLAAKMDMFNREEIRIFRESGFAPIFFGQGIFGARLPSLTYMVAFDNMEAREKCWKTFVASEAFNKIKKMPGWTDAEAVSNIYGSFLRPTPYSEIF